MSGLNRIEIGGVVYEPNDIYVEPSEIRVGNILESSDDSRYYYPRGCYVKVIGIKDDILQIENFPWPLEKRGKIRVIEPVSIDEYWLKKLQFDNTNDWTYTMELNDEEGIIARLQTNGDCQIWLGDVEIREPLENVKWLDELQNFYHSKTGKELEVQAGMDDLIDRIINADEVDELKTIYKKLKPEFGITSPEEFKKLELLILNSINKLLNDFDYNFRHMNDDDD
jgi:hypothetical protein